MTGTSLFFVYLYTHQLNPPSILPTTVNVSSTFIQTTDCLRRTPVCAIKNEIDSLCALLLLHSIGFTLVTFPQVTGGFDYSKIPHDNSRLHFLTEPSTQLSRQQNAQDPNGYWEQIREALHWGIAARWDPMLNKPQKKWMYSISLNLMEIRKLVCPEDARKRDV